MKLQKNQPSIGRKKFGTQGDKSKPIVKWVVGLIGVGAICVAKNKLSLNKEDDFDNWLETASDEELADGYEERRLEWLKNEYGDVTPEMRKIDDEMVRRSNEKYRKEHPNAEVRHREHGWYLPNDE